MPFVYGPWQNRTLTVTACTLNGGGSGSTGVTGTGLGRTNAGSTIGASAPGSFPWLDASKRTAAADRARNTKYGFHSGKGFPDTYQQVYYGDGVSGWNEGTTSRIVSETARGGIDSFTTADRALFGTNYDDWTFGMHLVSVNWNVASYWLANLNRKPPLGPAYQNKTAPLTPAEFTALWDWDPPAGSYYGYREIDVYGCDVDFATTFHYATSSPTPPGSFGRRLMNNPARYAVTWEESNVIEALPVAGSVSDGTTVTVGGSYPNPGTLDGPTLYVGSTGYPVAPGTAIPEYQLTQLYAPIAMDGCLNPSVSVQQTARSEFIVYEPQWPVGTVPDYDDTGAYPPGSLPGGGARGGPGADRWADVRITTDVTFTIRWRWVGYAPDLVTRPPLWQAGRIGVTDASESYSSGLITPQSSPWQGGTL